MNKLKKILKLIIKIKIVMIVLSIILVLTILLPAFTYFITIDDGTYDEDDWESTPYVASTYTDQVSISGNGLEPVKSANELWDEMTLKGNNIKDYLDKPEELEKLMNAEIITQYPKIGSGNLDGIVEFERHKTDGTSKMLKFIDYNTFNSYINSQNSDILNYFTLNDNKEVLIAIINKKTEELTTNDTDVVISEYTSALTDSDKKSDNTYKKEEYIITTQKINYKNYVEKYTMPFQYLWALLVISEDKDFVLDLADLVENSKIVISIYDNIKTIVDKNTYTYKKEQRTDTYAKVLAENNYGVEDYPKERYWLSEQSPEASEHYDSNYQADYETKEEQYEIVHTITDETNTTIVDISKADTWIADYNRKYNYQSSENESEERNSVTLENTEYTENSNSPENSDENKELLKDAHALELAQEAKKYIEQNAEQEEDNIDDKPLNITSPSDPFNVTLPNQSSNISENQNMIDSIIGTGITTGIIKPNKGNNNQVNNNETADNGVKDNNKKPVTAKVNVQYVQKRYYKHDIDRTHENVKTTSCQKYIAQPAQEEMKVEKGNGQVNFVTILCSKEHKSAKSLILKVDEWLFEILETNNDTKNMIDLTKYLLQKALEKDYGVSDFNFSEYGNNSFNSISGIYGSSFEEKVWFALRNAGYSEYAVAGAMGNLWAESGIVSNNLQNSYNQSLNMSDEQYTKEVNNGNYTRDQFINDEAGYGLAQWTFSSRKAGLYDLAKDNGVGIENEDIQIKYLITELQNYNIIDWENASSVKKACEIFCDTYENPKVKNYEPRNNKAQEYYEKYSGRTTPTFENATSKGRICPRYYQGDSRWASNPYNYKVGGTIESGGCGASALAMAVTGLTGNIVTPDVIVDYLNSQNIDTVSNQVDKAIRSVANKYNLACNWIDRNDKTNIDNALDSGKLLIFSIGANGIYTGQGHYIMCYGRDKDNYYVIESAMYYETDRPYTYNQVFSPGNVGVYALGK